VMAVGAVLSAALIAVDRAAVVVARLIHGRTTLPPACERPQRS
jgi:hypothetical protein